MQGEGHFLGYPWHLQTLPFRFSEFTKAPSDYLQQAPAYLKNWLGGRKTGAHTKDFMTIGKENRMGCFAFRTTGYVKQAIPVYMTYS
jgi:hypothetical protein